MPQSCFYEIIAAETKSCGFKLFIELLKVVNQMKNDGFSRINKRQKSVSLIITSLVCITFALVTLLQIGITTAFENSGVHNDINAANATDEMGDVHPSGFVRHLYDGKAVVDLTGLVSLVPVSGLHYQLFIAGEGEISVRIESGLYVFDDGRIVYALDSYDLSGTIFLYQFDEHSGVFEFVQKHNVQAHDITSFVGLTDSGIYSIAAVGFNENAIARIVLLRHN